MKRNFSKLALLALISLFVFSSCDTEEPTPPGPLPPTKLEAPKNITFDAKTKTFTWDKVKDATGYKHIVDNGLGLTIAPTHTANSATLDNNVTRDVWHTFWVCAVKGDLKSEPSYFDFIITDKTFLNTPDGLKYSVIERKDDKIALKITWDAVDHAVKYEFGYSIIKDSYNVDGTQTVTTTEGKIALFTAGSTIVVSVRAIPEAGSEYLPSKKAVATVENVK